MRFAGCLLTALLLLPGCGSGGQNRPVIIAAFPAADQVLNAPLGAVRITYDEPVTILNPNDARAFVNEVPIAVTMRQDPLEPCCVYVEPVPGNFFPANAIVLVRIERGAVINRDEHYAEEQFVYGFFAGSLPIQLGRGGVVTSMNPDTFALGSDVPTPGGRTAIGIQIVAPNNVPRVFVQLADGGGVREALAHFAPGDAAMTAVALSTDSGAGDLTATRRTIVPGPFGRSIYAAFRDESNGRVRLHRVDMATGAETGALELSVPAGADTRPLGMTYDPVVNQLFVACADGATGQQIYVDLGTFTEVDRMPQLGGKQGVPLPEAAGPIVRVDDQGIIAPGGTNTLTYTRTSSNSTAQNTTNAVGVSIDLLVTADLRVLLQPLTFYANQLGIVTRTSDNGYLDPALLVVADDVGAGSTGANQIRAMAPYPTENRFLGVLNTEVMVRWTWTGVGFDQDDLDPNTGGVQGIDVSATAPGITTISRTQGAYPAPQ